MFFKELTVVSTVLSSLLEVNLVLGGEKMFLEFFPGFCLMGLFVPALAIVKIQSCFVDKIVCVGKDLIAAVRLVAVLGKLLGGFDLINLYFKR